MRKLPGPRYQFDYVEFDPSNLQLTVEGEPRALEPKSYRLLAFLIENSGRVVTKDEILRAVWEETAVTDNALTRAVAQIRKALDDDPKEPRFIETVPTVGYRFIADVKPAEPEPAPVPTPVVALHPKPARWIGIAAAVLVLVAAAAVWKWNRQPKEEPVPPEPVSRPVPLTTYRGSEEAPSFSPDGNAVAFLWTGQKEDNLDIYVKVAGTDSTPLRLTTDPAPDAWPAWSPDGRTIAFVRLRGSDRFDLMLIPSLGGAERKLAELGLRAPANGFNPAWSADSKWLVVPGGVGDRADLFRVSVETGESERITDPGGTSGDGFPSISPDGATLLFTRLPAYSPGDLYEVRIDGNAKPVGSPHRIPGGPNLFGRAVWMPDGKELLAHAPTGVYRMPAAGSDNPRSISWLNSGVGSFDVARRGNRMAFSQVRGDGNVWRIDLTAKVPRPERLVASTFRDAAPQYSPDGRHIAFYSNRSGSLQTWLATAEGEQPRQLTFVQPGATGTPSWSPDGKTLALDSNTAGPYQVYTMSPDGGRLTQLTQGPAVNFVPRWSRDGRWLYFCSTRTGRNEIWKMPATGGAAVQVTHNGGVKAIESEDGRTLYFSKDTGSGSIWKIPAAGGPEEQLASSLYRFNFAAAKRGIYYMTERADDGTSTLKFYSFATGATTTITAMGRPEFGLDVSPDGRWLVYDQLDDPASDLMLVENFH